MEVAQQRRRLEPARKGRFAEALVLVSMVLVTLAAGTAAHLHGGLDVWTSASAALGAFVCLVGLHALVRRRKTVEAARSRDPRLESEFEKLGLGSESDGPVTSPRFSAKPVEVPPKLRRRRDGVPAFEPEFSLHDPLLSEPLSESDKRWEEVARRSGRGSPPPVPPSLSADLAKPPPLRNGLRKDGVQRRTVSDLANDDPDMEPAELTPAMRARQGDVEMLQAMIKKLADEVNAAEAAGHAGHGRERADLAVGRSVNALKTAAGSMRAAHRVAGASGSAGATRQGFSRGSKARLQAIKDALVAGRIDVLLEPILTLKDRKPRHFEVSLLLKDENGDILDLPRSHEGEDGRSILPIVDRVNIERTSQVALRLECRGRQGALFSSISGQSLAADKFLDGVTNAYRARESFAGQLVMTFTQADVRAFGEREWANLADLADLGFRFAIGSITDLDMDFAELKASGFEFAKLDASVFLDGLMAGETLVPARDICRHLADIGLTLIVGQIDDEQVAARIFGFGVLFGQGSMFGGPRPVKRGALETGKGHAAA